MLWTRFDQDIHFREFVSDLQTEMVKEQHRLGNKDVAVDILGHTSFLAP